MSNTPVKSGDKIRVIALIHDDPLPPPVGATGTVVEVHEEYEDHRKVYVKWDDGVVAVNALLIPHDSHAFEVVTP